MASNSTFKAEYTPDKITVELSLPLSRKNSPESRALIKQAIGFLNNLLLDDREISSNEAKMPFNFDSRANAAVMLGQFSFIFFENKSGQLAYLWFKGAETTADETKAYVPVTVIARKPGEPGGNPIELDEESPQVTAVSWERGGEYHLRVYYLDTKARVRELCWDTRDVAKDADWFHGKFNSSITDVADKTAPLASLIQVGGIDQLKVYYKRAGGKLQQVAYANVGQTNWSQREIFNSD